MKPITVWRSQEKNEETQELNWALHHIEDGHCLNDTPTVLKDSDRTEFKSQKGWKSQKWQKQFAYLDHNYKVIYE